MSRASTRQATRQELIEEVERLRKELNKEKEKYNLVIKENLNDKYKEVLEKTLKKYIDKDFISKNKIKEKIEELEKFGAMLDKESTVSQFTANVVSIRYLKDLLKESENQ